MSTRRRPVMALALLAQLALITACGSGARSATSTAADGALAHAQQGVKFAQCMRSHGVGNFPDPDASGKLTIDAVANGSAVNTQSPAFTQALSACKTLQPAGFTGSPRSSAQQAAARTFARCVRAHGVADFPDPVNGQPLVDTNRIPSTNSSAGMSRLHVAMQACQSAAAAAGVTR